MDELYVPPCCIHLKLPPLVKEGGLHSTFYSQGDWGIQKLWHALSLLVDGERGTIFTALVVNDVEIFTLRYFRECFDRGWIDAMLLVTQSDKTELIRTEMASYLDRITYVPNRSEAMHANMWIRSNSHSSLTVMGPMSISEDGTGYFCSYTSCYESANGQHGSCEHAKQALRPWRSIAHISASIRASSPLLKQWV